MRKTILFFIIIFSIVYGKNSRSVLVEAESFEIKGGWKVDPQFMEQMGSPYLLAHGLGTPVENAKTEVSFHKKGKYHIWVRTMNWAPGDWEAPGRFKLVINSKPLERELGTRKNWQWQYAGAMKLPKGKSIIELKDLTGFEGRCDAIYFSKTKQAPPNGSKELAKWRKKILQETTVPQEVHQFDLVVVGGGISGCAAAIASAEQGMEVALIHDRPVLGGNASSEIRVHTEGIAWKSKSIINMINTKHWPNGSPKAKKDDKKRYRNIEKYKNIHLFLNWRAYGTDTIKNKIVAVDAKHTSTGKRKRFEAPLFVDCTGDGWIGYWSGAEYMYGRESHRKFNEKWEKYGQLWSPENLDNRVMGSSVLWLTEKTDSVIDFPDVPWAKKVVKDHAATHGTWKWEYSSNDLHQIHDAEKIRDHMFKAIYGSFSNAKKNPENDSLKLKWISYLIGKRESRRLVGDYIYTFNDVREKRKFKDRIIMEKRAVDVHFQQKLKDESRPDFLSEALYYEVDHYYIPYRTLYSKNIENLFMAGRCFSCSHIGLGGPRVMHTTGQMGVAVGFAASLCKKYDVNPRQIYEEYIKDLQQLIMNE